jgi:hypothetical protein
MGGMKGERKKGSRAIPMNAHLLLMIQTTLSMVRASLSGVKYIGL